MSVAPTRRISLSRRSSRAIRMKMMKMTISIVVASGPSKGLMRATSVCSGPPDGSWTSTGIRRLPGAAAAAPAAASQALDLLADRLLILRQILGEARNLGRQHSTEREDRCEGDENDNHDRE